MLSAGISEPWDRRSSLRSSNLSSVLVLTTSGVPLWEWSVVWPSSPSDTDRFSELNVDTDWHLVMLVGLLGRGTVTSLNYRTDSTEDWRRLEIILVFFWLRNLRERKSGSREFSRLTKDVKLLTVSLVTPPHCRLRPPPPLMTLHASVVRRRKRTFRALSEEYTEVQTHVLYPSLYLFTCDSCPV